MIGPRIEQPQLREITEVISEAPGVKTLVIRHSTAYKPGQFFMIWLPGVGEKPFSLSHHFEGEVGITVKERGPFTHALFSLTPGSAIGLRGPYGNGFSVVERSRRACVVAGGIGIVPLAALIDRLQQPLVIYGARSQDLLIFRNRFPEVSFATDDGSEGFHGSAVEAFRSLLDPKATDVVYTCGPEPMMRQVFDICEAHHLPCQAALERYIKCGIGICGQCCCDGYLVCRDGPVFSSSLLRQLSDFGRSARLRDGRVTTIEDYASWRES
ncbi:hypothetical protein AMJ39_05015 [candidate division TA06 bacterium DG_24]|uniref:FAD-binding FR-type domain-containing protein n=3 Tax=Bacteria division TA06 TaxID=1156500 RepID=A0A0S8JNR9_UNCT6|nr:MAG: hypothetical protein AMJ39_05015 [candidate division TA06 bacterium DG_24]KPK68315.1 MAG: hypothetical protein AMJ82_08515 [candidate division TA06 bacterium SM23_40]KPL11383.1 MAG: hypothetical protein AMJ71_01050 [candidate division TA06 bacterium SM1_40]